MYITVFKNKLLTKVDAPKNWLAHENHCIKRPSQLQRFHSISLDFFPLVNALVYVDIRWNDETFQCDFSFYYRLVDNQTHVHKEYLIYDVMNMIGSVGGTLGLFIGFSCSNVVSIVLHQFGNCLSFFMSRLFMSRLH